MGNKILFDYYNKRCFCSKMLSSTDFLFRFFLSKVWNLEFASILSKQQKCVIRMVWFSFYLSKALYFFWLCNVYKTVHHMPDVIEWFSITTYFCPTESLKLHIKISSNCLWSVLYNRWIFYWEVLIFFIGVFLDT